MTLDSIGKTLLIIKVTKLRRQHIAYIGTYSTYNSPIQDELQIAHVTLLQRPHMNKADQASSF